MSKIKRRLKPVLLIFLLSGFISAQTFAQEANCDDRIDNDGDGLVDCFDPNCGCYTCDNDQDNYWLFGLNVSLDFNTLNSGTPNMSQNSSVGAYEGVASVSDPNGNFLFATDGIDIVGPNLAGSGSQIVDFSVNNNGITLKGGFSSTHAAVVVPNPNDQQEYYIFTAGDDISNQHGINAVNIRFENITSSTFIDLEASLSLPTNHSLLPAGQNTEKLAVARHSNCTDYWVVTHDFGATTNDGKNYIAYKVDQSGINAGVNSAQTASHVIDAGRDHAMRGQLSFSEDYTTLVAAIYGETPSGGPGGHSNSISGFVEITSFDNTTGNVTPSKILPLNGYNPYGVSLSPSKRYLYVTARDFVSIPNDPRDKLLYYDLQAGSIQDILNSQTEIPLTWFLGNPVVLGQLKIGSNDQLYLAVADRGVIELDPENPAPYTTGIPPTFLTNNRTRFGLPQTIPDYCEPSVKTFISPKVFCVGEPVYVSAAPVTAAAPVNFTWSTGQMNTSFIDYPQQSVNYTVTLTDHYGCSATGQTGATANGALAIPNFHYEDAAGNVKTVFQCGEDIFLNGFASINEADHWLDLWEVTPSGLSIITGGSWAGGPISTLYDLDDFFGVTFQPGKTYQVKLAVQNLPCTGWDEMVLNFTIATPTADPDFVMAFSGQSGSLATVTLTADPNALDVEHLWIVRDASNFALMYNSGWTSNDNPTFNLPQGTYIIYHTVRNLDCGVQESTNKILTLDWESDVQGGKKLAVVELDKASAKFDFELYPNPATDLVNITTEKSIESIRVLDMHGRTIKQLHGAERTIPINNLAAGVYIVELTATDGIAQKRFIKK